MSESAIPALEGERWLPIPSYEGFYDVSAHGRVRSHYRGGRIRKLTAGEWYWAVALYRDGQPKLYHVHRLVAMAFIGPIPKGMEVLHGPAGSWVNHVSNLRIGTQRENIHDKFRDGTMPLGEDHHGAKLTEALVIQLRARYAAGENSHALARALGVSQYAVWCALTGARWGHVPGEPVQMRAARGEVLPQAKLTTADIPGIRARCAAGEEQQALAAEFGVSKAAISAVIRGKTWRHVA